MFTLGSLELYLQGGRVWLAQIHVNIRNKTKKENTRCVCFNQLPVFERYVVSIVDTQKTVPDLFIKTMYALDFYKQMQTIITV